MTLWIILTAITAGVAVWAAIPLLCRSDATETPNEATKGEKAATTAPASFGARNFAAIGIAAVVALGAAILYAKISLSNRVATAHSTDRAGNKSAMPARHPVVPAPTGRGPSAGAGGRQGGDQGNSTTIDGMIEKLVQRLKANPDDANGWRTLAWSYAAQGRFAEAATAYDEAIKRQPDNADLYGARGELMVRTSNGVVTPEAAGLFAEALKRDKDNPRARFFLGLRKEQAGDHMAALDDWIAILQGASPNEPWARDLRERIEQTAADYKVDLTGRLPVESIPEAAAGAGAQGPLQEEKRPAPQAGAATSAKSMPTADGQRPAAASAEDQMIRNMVDGLAARLEKQPRDFEGWTRLIRSRAVLGDMDKAKAALARAREIFADTPDALGAIGATARDLGLDP